MFWYYVCLPQAQERRHLEARRVFESSIWAFLTERNMLTSVAVLDFDILLGKRKRDRESRHQVVWHVFWFVTLLRSWKKREETWWVRNCVLVPICALAQAIQKFLLWWQGIFELSIWALLGKRRNMSVCNSSFGSLICCPGRNGRQRERRHEVGLDFFLV